ncbi:metalloendopeptidase OMA1 [Hyphodiscus hymeniophilus]|uniref:Metalloendopeptidase OMA1 n=1 Tax=Hyphodiscus hymeniophilus TaxID=353542 RepID=A0A9P6VRM1_9HELO|nr:metalloendopeptidase OMA1 [Hyphodiscus hymeniophilus]
MISRHLLRAIRPLNIPRTVPRIFPKPTLPNASLAFRRFESQFRRYPPPPPPRKPDRIIHTRWDPEHARNAKPLFSDRQLGSAVVSPPALVMIVVVVGGGAIYYVSNLEEVPVSGRRRFNCYSDASVEREGEMMYKMVMQDAINNGSLLPEWDKRSRMVQRVMERLIPASGLQDQQWEVHVIDSNEKNAFVIPGGKVFVYSGILPIAKNDDGLAAILGHEIAHNLARHAAEHMSSMVLLLPLKWALMVGFNMADATGLTLGLGQWLGPWLSNTVLEFGIAMPASRTQESEADYIGLMMMAKSCYDPHAAVGVWQRMEEAEKNGIPQWMSTHPSNVTRIAKMEEWLPKAEEARDESGCAITTQYSRGFQQALGVEGGWGGLI